MLFCRFIFLICSFFSSSFITSLMSFFSNCNSFCNGLFGKSFFIKKYPPPRKTVTTIIFFINYRFLSILTAPNVATNTTPPKSNAPQPPPELFSSEGSSFFSSALTGSALTLVSSLTFASSLT